MINPDFVIRKWEPGQRGTNVGRKLKTVKNDSVDLVLSNNKGRHVQNGLSASIYKISEYPVLSWMHHKDYQNFQ